MLDGATGALEKARAIPMKQPNEQPGIDWSESSLNVHAIGGAIALVGGHWVGGYDATTLAELWWTEPDGGGIPQFESDGARLVMGVPARLGKGDPGPVLAQLEPRTGKDVWRTVLPDDGQLVRFAIDGARIYAMVQSGDAWLTLDAVDAATGKLLWQRRLPSDRHEYAYAPFTMIPSGELLVLGVHGVRVRVLDASTGKDRRGVDATGRSFAVRDGVVFALGDDTLAAYTLATGTREWTRPAQGGDFSLTATALHYRDRDERLHAIDLKTGAELATYDLAGYDRVYGGSPQLIACGHGNLLALDPTGTVTPPERATITGTVAVTGLPKGVAPPRQVFAGNRHEALAHGAFKLEVEGRGTIRVTAPLPDSGFLTGSDGYDYKPCEMYVELVGKHAYRASCTGRVTSNYP